MSSSPTLVINCGSSSLKFALLDPQQGTLLLQGLAERLNSAAARLEIAGQALPLPSGANHAQVLEQVFATLTEHDVQGVGHRVVHGGELFSESVVVNDHVLAQIRQCADLAPLHNPANILGIEAAQRCFPRATHVAVFDTAFHQTLPPKAYLYAIPFELYQQHKIRRYGFHGSSHSYVAAEAARRLGKPLSELQLITAHLGNGCSACAVRQGVSVDTSMGLTPLEGLVMGTRSGDVDPNLHQFLADHAGLSLPEVTDLLNRKSGLLGLSGLSNDVRTLLQAPPADQPRAQLALDVFCYRLAKVILGLSAALQRVDALVFTGGIGEHAAAVRAQTCAHLGVLRLELDAQLNAAHGKQHAGRISSQDSAVVTLVVPTNEELVIARETARLLQSTAPTLAQS